MLFGLATTAQTAGWQNTGVANPRRTGTASTNASLGWNAATGTTTSTTQFKYGTASERLTSTFSEIYSNVTSIGGFGTNDFTIECYIWIDALANHSSSCDAYSHDTTTGFGFRLAQSFNTKGLSGGTDPQFLNIFSRNTADLDYWTLPGTWPTGQWNFVVIQRKSGSFAAWVNGTLLAKSNASSSYAFDTTTAQLKIGTADSSNGLGPTTGSNYVYIDEFCISNTYRYTDTAANIPVPTAPFTVDSYTVQLLHMDGTNGGTTFTNATS